MKTKSVLIGPFVDRSGTASTVTRGGNREVDFSDVVVVFNPGDEVQIFT